MELKNKRGFTLLEIIIVVIIIGIVASLALPKLFRSTEFARAQEALGMLGTIRGAMDRCYVITNTFTGCSSFANLDVQDPVTADANATHFSYSWPIAPTATNWTILATRLSKSGGTAGDTIQINQFGQKTGVGNFVNIR